MSISTVAESPTVAAAFSARISSFGCRRSTNRSFRMNAHVPSHPSGFFCATLVLRRINNLCLLRNMQYHFWKRTRNVSTASCSCACGNPPEKVGISAGSFAMTVSEVTEAPFFLRVLILSTMTWSMSLVEARRPVCNERCPAQSVCFENLFPVSDELLVDAEYPCRPTPADDVSTAALKRTTSSFGRFSYEMRPVGPVLRRSVKGAGGYPDLRTFLFFLGGQLVTGRGQACPRAATAPFPPELLLVDLVHRGLKRELARRSRSCCVHSFF